MANLTILYHMALSSEGISEGEQTLNVNTSFWLQATFLSVCPRSTGSYLSVCPTSTGKVLAYVSVRPRIVFGYKLLF